MVAATPAQNAAHGPNGLAAMAPNPDHDKRGQQHPVSGQREPRRHHRIPMLGDHVAGVAIAGHGRGATDSGQG
jgi:hypothetical protein